MHKNNLKSNHYLHWGQISSDPNHPDVRAHLRAILRARYRGRVESTKDFLKDFVRGYSVLDIGAVAHSLERAQSPAWKHNVIRSVATKVTGVDIVEEAVNALVTQGLDLRCIDATSEVDMGDRFERVVIGDVIEHVDSPVKLLQFAMRHLTPQGQILCTTPNSSSS
jgi:2-polyprenyl-3-methyl-5-hydroxy-6-metoxy-1,4-benzoquinol methylase